MGLVPFFYRAQKKDPDYSPGLFLITNRLLLLLILLDDLVKSFLRL